MYSQITDNKRKTIVMLAVFAVLVGCLGYLVSLYVGRPTITPYVLVGAGIYAAISYYASSKLAMALNGAHEIQKEENPRLWRIVENLAITNGMPTPKVYVIDDIAPNAFATGRDPNNAIVGVTTGLLDIMADTELEGVIAHEMGHIKNYDIRVSLLAFALVAAVSLLADIMLHLAWFGGRDRRRENEGGTVLFVLGLVAAILAPLIATLIQLAISRKREFLADATGALTTRYPEGLASALEKIAQTGSTLRHQNSSTAHLFFANPLKKKSFSGLLSTHPPVAERVARLHEMEHHQ